MKPNSQHPSEYSSSRRRNDQSSGQGYPSRSAAARRAEARARAAQRRKEQLCTTLLCVTLLLTIALFVVCAARCSAIRDNHGLPTVSDTGTGDTDVTDESSSGSINGSNGHVTDVPSSGSANGNNGHVTDSATTVPDTDVVPSFSFALPDSVQSRYVLLINRETGEVLAERNADTITYPASITKVMTVLTAIEELDDLNMSVTITQDLINRLIAAEASRAGFSAGEVVKAKDMLYASLLPSGADGSVGLAELVSGSEEDFAALMTAKAKKLGMKNTNFTNATGLHDDAHYSTCRDLAIMLNYALENETFREVFTTDSYHTEATNKHESGIWMRSSMFKKLEKEMLTRSYFVGGKTGFTEEAGVCLASVAEHNGTEYLLITLGAGDGTNRVNWQVQDAVAIFDALFAKIG